MLPARQHGNRCCREPHNRGSRLGRGCLPQLPAAPRVRRIGRDPGSRPATMKLQKAATGWLRRGLCGEMMPPVPLTAIGTRRRAPQPCQCRAAEGPQPSQARPGEGRLRPATPEKSCCSRVVGRGPWAPDRWPRPPRLSPGPLRAGPDHPWPCSGPGACRLLVLWLRACGSSGGGGGGGWSLHVQLGPDLVCAASRHHHGDFAATTAPPASLPQRFPTALPRMLFSVWRARAAEQAQATVPPSRSRSFENRHSQTQVVGD